MKTILVWFRRDLRIADNPALYAAKSHRAIPIYIDAPDEEAPWQPGAASRWWLHHSLGALATQLKKTGSRLIIRQGGTRASLLKLIEETGASAVYCNRLYEPATIKRDTTIKQILSDHDIEYKSFASHLLFEPWQVQTKTATPYKVFTPFWNTCQKIGLPSDIKPTIRKLASVPTRLKSLSIADLGLLPTIKWDKTFYSHWRIGEVPAQKRLTEFIRLHLSDYQQGRDYPSLSATSRLSPSLHFGEISPRQIVYALEQAVQKGASNKNIQGFLRELVWREFTHHILYHFPHTLKKPLNARFEKFPWNTRGNKLLRAWQQGQTGYPIIDAGMQELWTTGTMHNRVRMIVGSLLTKNMNAHWLQGAKWFWQTLVDADLAQNTFNWQWIAGCGADAAPYFRIFNPITQSEKFDARGEYIRQWVAPLQHVPNKYIHQPWRMDDAEQRKYQCTIGVDYPAPVLDLKTSREDALLRYKKTRNH